MATVVEELHEFDAEINALWAKNDFNFGEHADPVMIVSEGLLKAACGYHNGSTVESILVNLGMIVSRRNGADELTRKGKRFLWLMNCDKPL